MAKTSSWIFGIIFIIAGIWGFFSGTVLGFLGADMLSSIVHVVVGVVLLAMAGKSSAAGTLKTVGILYIVFAILGFLQGTWVLFGVFATNMASNWFYLVVGIVIAILGWTAKGGSMAAPMASTPPSAPQM